MQVSEVEQNICASDDFAEITQSRKLLLKLIVTSFEGVRNLIEDKDVNGSAILRVVALFALKFGAQNEQTLRSLSASACQAKNIERKEFDSKIRGIRDYSSGLQVSLNNSIKLINNSISSGRRVIK